MPITFAEWQNAVNTKIKTAKSAELTAVTNAFSTYNTNPNVTNLNALATNLQTWRTTFTVQLTRERSNLASEMLELESTITFAKQTNKVINVKAREVGAVGWTYRVWDPLNPGALHPGLAGMNEVLPNQVLPPLTPSELTRVNEAFRRAKKAATVARNELIPIAKKTSLTAPFSPGEQSYVDYFGAFNQAQAKKVLNNFEALHLAFTGTPTFVDMRNTDFGLTSYAACQRVNLVSKETGTGRLTLNGTVFMLLCRSFFDKGTYSGSTDATVGTLVHEFSHGTFKAVDAPKVTIGMAWELTPAEEGDPDHEDHGETPDNDEQSSTRVLDKRLALKSPTIAQRNADNYGQYASEALIRSGEF